MACRAARGSRRSKPCGDEASAPKLSCTCVVVIFDCDKKAVDARNKSGHDGANSPAHAVSYTKANPRLYTRRPKVSSFVGASRGPQKRKRFWGAPHCLALVGYARGGKRATQ